MPTTKAEMVIMALLMEQRIQQTGLEIRFFNLFILGIFLLQ